MDELTKHCDCGGTMREYCRVYGVGTVAIVLECAACRQRGRWVSEGWEMYAQQFPDRPRWLLPIPSA